MADIECFCCGKIHSGDCKFEDLEVVRQRVEKQNKCSWCGKFSEKSTLHPECVADESKWLDEEKAFDASIDTRMAA